MSAPRLLEICVDEPASVHAAIAGGADRLELCSALALGGLTPSPAFVAMAVAAARDSGIAVRAMVRPRSGDFTYDADEIAQAIDEAQALRTLGIDGLVFGAARDGRLDTPALARWVDAIGGGIGLTLHRTIDTVADPVAAIADARALGFDRVLTSGGATGVGEGLETIARMVAAAGDGLTVMAGAGVTADGLPGLIRETGVREVHASASRALGSDDARVVALGFADPPRRLTDAATVRALRDALDREEI